ASGHCISRVLADHRNRRSLWVYPEPWTSTGTFRDAHLCPDATLVIWSWRHHGWGSTAEQSDAKFPCIGPRKSSSAAVEALRDRLPIPLLPRRTQPVHKPL